MIKMDNKTMLFRKMYDKGVIFMNDITVDDGNLLDIHKFNWKYGSNINFLDYSGINFTYKKMIKTIKRLFYTNQKPKSNNINIFFRSRKGKISMNNSEQNGNHPVIFCKKMTFQFFFQKSHDYM